MLLLPHIRVTGTCEQALWVWRSKQRAAARTLQQRQLAANMRVAAPGRPGCTSDRLCMNTRKPSCTPLTRLCRPSACGTYRPRGRGHVVRSGLSDFASAADQAAQLVGSAANDVVQHLPSDVGQVLPHFHSSHVGTLLQSLQDAINGPVDVPFPVDLAAPSADALSHAQHAASMELHQLADQALPTLQSVMADAPTAAAAALQAPEVVVPLAAGAHAQAARIQQNTQMLQGLTGWIAMQLPELRAVSSEAALSMSSSLDSLSTTLHQAVAADVANHTQQMASGLVLGVQQLVTTLQLQEGASSVTAMAAAQEAMAGSFTASSGLEGVTTVSLMLVALVAATLPRGSSLREAAAAEGTYSGDEVPLRYDPDALTAYWAKRPMQVLQRNTVVVSRIGGFVTSILADWQLGQWEANMPKRAQEARKIIESLGPAYVKIGQSLSTRVDILPETYVKELEKLQDNVPVFSTMEARQVLEEGLGCPVERVFDWLTEEPLASASLGQVYRGQLRPEYGGSQVAVKVQRPGVLEAAALDIYVMRRAALIFSKLPGMREEWAGVLDEWALRFFQEMDYQLEAYNTSTFKRQMANLDGITVPDIHADLTSRKILVMSWVEGDKLSESSGEDVQRLCSLLLNCYLIQLLETGFLHADPHPGNLMRTADGKLVILDFGLMTEVTEDQRVALVEFITHLTLEDWVGVANDMVTLGFMPEGLPPGADVEGEVAPLLQKVMGQLVRGGGLRNGINVFSLTHELEHVAKAYSVVVPPYFTLVLRAFSTIEGIALKVNPNYSIVSECLPYLSRRLLSDNNPRMRAALRHLLYGDGKRIDMARLSKMMSAFSNFSTDAGVQQPNSSNPNWSNAYSSGDRVKCQQPAGTPASSSGWGAAPGGGWGERGAGGVAGWEAPPIVSQGVKEALKVVFSKDGSYAQELIADELVAAVDAMSREAVNEALRLMVGSTASMAALRSAEALGPLRSMFLPLPLPAEVLMSLQPAVALSEEDRQTLDSLRMLMQLVSPGSASGLGVGLGEVAAGAPRAMQAAGELMPLMPEIMPGLQSTLELFMRQLVRRIALRIADDLQPGQASSSSYSPGQAGNSGGAGGLYPGGGAGGNPMSMPSPAFSYVSHYPQYGAPQQQGAVRHAVAPGQPGALGGANQKTGKRAGKPQVSGAWGQGAQEGGKRWA